MRWHICLVSRSSRSTATPQSETHSTSQILTKQETHQMSP